MSIHRKLVKSVQALFRDVFRTAKGITKNLMSWLLRSLLVSRRRSRLSQAGFVLPTVTMVLLVVMLLTTAIMFRSFDRTKNISNYRVNQQVLNAALPAIDRAKAKITTLLSDPTLPRATPSEDALDTALQNSTYNLGDETRLQLAYQSSSNPRVTSTDAWRFPVDSDNNGKYDSFTLYNILFRTPDSTSNGEDKTERTPLEARTKPMQEGKGGSNCATGNAGVNNIKGWYTIGSQVKRSFFVYVATVPITDKTQAGIIPTPPPGTSSTNPIYIATNYENYQGGNKGFSGLEYQQDQAQVPAANNAILYDDDLEITAGGQFQVNGRIVTNSNLFVAGQKAGTQGVTLLQVSSPKSCYYNEQNGKIVVGGNLGFGFTAAPTNLSLNPISVDLYQGPGVAPTQNQPLGSGDVSSSNPLAEMAYNNLAFEARIQKLVDDWTTAKPTAASDPKEVQQLTNKQVNGPAKVDPTVARQKALDTYFRERTRRVPYKEVAYGATDTSLSSTTYTTDGGDPETLRPEDKWMYPFNPATGNKDGSSYAEVNLNGGTQLKPSATDFKTQEADPQKQDYLGDRVVIGNNLPPKWIDSSSGKNKWATQDTEQKIEGTQWDNPNPKETPRARKTRAALISDAADTTRDGFWETQAATPPTQTSDGTGGLRLVTGAGIYLPAKHDILTLARASTVVWPDWMPVIPPPNRLGTPPPTWLPGSDYPKDANGNYRPFLQMRATAVYHYTYKDGQEPIACVSSFYDPTNQNTAKNLSSSQYNPGNPLTTNPNNGFSNNGVTYHPPTTNAPSEIIETYLKHQAKLVYPNGRLVNQQLSDALKATPRSLSQQAAIDSAICGLQILGIGGSISPTETLTGTLGSYTLKHGTIKETAFLDARQIKSIDKDFTPYDASSSTPPPRQTGFGSLTANYDLPVEQRQPLEIRATVIDLDKLRQAPTPQWLSSDEFMLPNSGIIYATRDDALPDASSPSNPIRRNTPDAKNAQLKLSAADFKLDPTRRPNAIMLTNGQKLWREQKYRQIEQGLILATNLPAYVKAQSATTPGALASYKGGVFNPHANTGGEVAEFKDPPSTPFYSRQDNTLPTNFACRQGQPGQVCPNPDDWRPATVIADAVTLLSSGPPATSPKFPTGFQEGYRQDGDYDLRNNETDNVADPDISLSGRSTTELKGTTDLTALGRRTAALNQGFWDNNFVTSHQFTDTDYSQAKSVGDVPNSSYFNNYVTPVQRRGDKFPELLMEVCPKRVVADCQHGDWTVDGGSTKASNKPQSLTQTYRKSTKIAPTVFKAGTTVDPPYNDPIPNNSFGQYPRRVAFLRDITNDQLVLSSGKPIVLGINNGGNVGCFAFDGTSPTVTISRRRLRPPVAAVKVTCNPYKVGTGPTEIRTGNNALWFAAAHGSPGDFTKNPPVYLQDGTPLPTPSPLPPGITSLPPLVSGSRGTTNQPLLIPVLQIQYPTAPPAANPVENGRSRITQWIPPAAGDALFNIVMATGDNPSHPATTTDDGDFNGGVPNLPRFIENWNDPQSGNFSTTKINGSFIQLKRSSYATAPNTQLPTANKSGNSYPGTFLKTSLFSETQGYNTGNNSGRAPSYEPPNREWGFDVGLLSQQPDLFSKQFTIPPSEKPNQYFREVGRDDKWTSTLLCATASSTPAINNNQRPSSCP